MAGGDPLPRLVVTAQVYLRNVRLEDGPTAILPGSHRSGSLPPHERMWDLDLTYEGRGAAVHTGRGCDAVRLGHLGTAVCPRARARAGGTSCSASMPAREIAPRVLPSEREAAPLARRRERAGTLRQRQLIGCTKPCFYDG